ncbi:hypothetical protein [uncultured Lamprocystis sp.]|jgi:hypothetical protein|uniref:hypothetical protein n=1 Tax=uncultured Lamprocystis sp. TaxID=543132 RepID=UPI0025FFC97A|nr:hypothetical protein [uncultured Lamprocystis sp.]
MSIRSLPAALAAALLSLSVLPVLAAETAPAMVTFTGEANMPSLKDAKQRDKFTIGLTDSQVISTFNLECRAGTSALGGLVKGNEECAISGNGAIINPRDASQRFPRAQYTGGFVVETDGTTDMSKILVTYLPVGKVPASSSSVAGMIKLKPENPSATAGMLKDSVLKHLRDTVGDAGTMVDTRVDTVEIPDLFIPSAGFASDKGCTWRGSMAFAYQSKSWFMDLTATCGDKSYALKGNMPWVDVPGVKDRTQYNLVLTLPSAETASDDAMFAAPTGDGDMFAAADGLGGAIMMDQGMYVETLVDGKTERLPMHTKISGSLSGQGVPLETVRSFSQLITLLARTFFGA